MKKFSCIPFVLLLITGLFFSCNKETINEQKVIKNSDIETQLVPTENRSKKPISSSINCDRKDLCADDFSSAGEYVSAIIAELDFAVDCRKSCTGTQDVHFSVGSGPTICGPDFDFPDLDHYDDANFMQSLCSTNNVAYCLDENGNSTPYQINPTCFTVEMQDEMIEKVFSWARKNLHIGQYKAYCEFTKGLSSCPNGYMGLLDIDICWDAVLCPCGLSSPEWNCEDAYEQHLTNIIVGAVAYYGCCCGN